MNRHETCAWLAAALAAGCSKPRRDWRESWPFLGFLLCLPVVRKVPRWLYHYQTVSFLWFFLPRRALVGLEIDRCYYHDYQQHGQTAIDYIQGFHGLLSYQNPKHQNKLKRGHAATFPKLVHASDWIRSRTAIDLSSCFFSIRPPLLASGKCVDQWVKALNAAHIVWPSSRVSLL